MSKRNAMATLTRWVLGHKKLVVGLWIALAIAGVAAMGPAGKAFDEQFNIPGKEAFEANSQIVATYGNGGDVAPLVPVVSLPAGRTVDSPGVRAELERALGRVADRAPRGPHRVLRLHARPHLRLPRRPHDLRPGLRPRRGHGARPGRGAPGAGRARRRHRRRSARSR